MIPGMKKELYKTQNFIAGRWTEAASGSFFEKHPPAHLSRVLGRFPQSSSVEVEAAVEAALTAFPEWKKRPAPARGDLLFQASRLMKDSADGWADIISNETGKSVSDALFEIQAAAEYASLIAGEGRRFFGRTTPSSRSNRFCMTVRAPIGVAALLPSWNFPALTTAWKLFPALLCGNAVVLKAEENTPGSMAVFAHFLEKAGFPRGVFNVVHGSGAFAGEKLVAHPSVGVVSFTGSSEVGRRIGTVCAERHAKCILEMGGKNALVVLDDADLEGAVEAAVRGAFSFAGQRCTATGRFIVHAKVFEAFKKKLLKAVLRVKPEPLIHTRQFERVRGFVERAGDGTKLLCGGHKLRGAAFAKGCYFEPTVFEARPDAEIAREEVFGPVAVLIKARTTREAFQINNDSRYGLSAAVWTKDFSKAMTFLEEAEVGFCSVNAATYGAESHLPFGGVKDSGNGVREAGWSAVEAFSETKSLYIDH